MVLHVSTFTRPVTFAVLLQALASTSIYAATPTEEMSQTVEKLCPALKKVFTANPAALTPAQQDVFFRCGELKLAPGQSFSDLTGDQLTGLNTMTSDETSSMSTSTVELSGAQGVALTGRLATVRSRSTVSVASLTPSYPVNGRGLKEWRKALLQMIRPGPGIFQKVRLWLWMVDSARSLIMGSGEFSLRPHTEPGIRMQLPENPDLISIPGALFPALITV
ncbi:hypothetical protein DGMP_25850 [Desulfomarina profundi]|uniref:Uncharacterized protein n=1 Tax=Desulfomarina profundi TaxID=2772557 RepID=A0A8D5FXP9_9BACT|nr:hypothetical protein DGMP_25850 [Desulfomarina profundi]